MTPKERVRANIYKTLLEEEKKKNKKLSVVSLSVFLVGVFASSGYQALRPQMDQSPMATNYALEEPVEEFETDKFMLDAIYNTGVLSEKTVELNPDEIFGLDTQI